MQKFNTICEQINDNVKETLNISQYFNEQVSWGKICAQIEYEMFFIPPQLSLNRNHEAIKDGSNPRENFACLTYYVDNNVVQELTKHFIDNLNLLPIK